MPSHNTTRDDQIAPGIPGKIKQLELQLLTLLTQRLKCQPNVEAETFLRMTIFIDWRKSNTKSTMCSDVLQLTADSTSSLAELEDYSSLRSMISALTLSTNLGRGMTLNNTFLAGMSFHETQPLESTKSRELWNRR